MGKRSRKKRYTAEERAQREKAVALHYRKRRQFLTEVQQSAERDREDREAAAHETRVNDAQSRQQTDYPGMDDWRHK